MIQKMSFDRLKFIIVNKKPIGFFFEGDLGFKAVTSVSKMNGLLSIYRVLWVFIERSSLG